jgi:hypothetical protein
MATTTWHPAPKRELLQDVMKAHPTLTLKRALQHLREAGM